MDYPVSDFLRAKLTGEVRSETVGAVTKRGMKEPGAAVEGARRQCPATQGEVDGGIRLVWNNPTLRKQAAIKAPLLKAVE